MPDDTSREAGVTLDADLHIPIESGTIGATRYTPTHAEGPLPAVIMAIPYRKDDRITFGAYDPDLRYLAHHGYDVLAVDLLGTGASSGMKSEPFDGTEGPQLAAVIEWVADREWCTGKVGMYGKSYGGWTQLKAAAENPPSLEAIVPIEITNSAYETSIAGGVFNLQKRSMWPTQMYASLALPPSRRDTDGWWAETWMDRLEAMGALRPWLFQFRDHERKDDYWDDKEVDVSEIDVPTLAVCGYRDVHTSEMASYFEDLSGPKRLVLGPWRHTMPHAGRETAINFREQAVEWFDHFLKGEDNPTRDHPPVAYWTERDGGWTVGAGAWRRRDSWPTVDTADTCSFSLTPAGLARDEAYTEGRVEREYEFDHTVGIESMDRIGFVTNDASDTTADDARSVVFETDPLTDPVEFTGTGVATVRIRPTTADPILAVRVNDVGPDGTATAMTNGYIRASHRHSHSDPTELEPGEEYEIPVSLKPKSHVFETGHRIRVAVSAAFFPRTLPTREHGSFTVLSSPDDPSTLTFPGETHDGGVQFDDEITMEPPDDAVVPVSSEFVTNKHSGWETSRDHARDEATFGMSQDYTIELPHGAEMEWCHDVSASVVADEPLSAHIENEVVATLDYGTERVTATAASWVSRDVAVLETTVTLDDQVVFEERWRR
jgi:putative CocE/NonD family hydrolase